MTTWTGSWVFSNYLQLLLNGAIISFPDKLWLSFWNCCCLVSRSHLRLQGVNPQCLVDICYWWLRESSEWLLSSFCPKIMEGGGTYECHFIILLLQVEFRRQSEVVGTLKPCLLLSQKFEYFAFPYTHPYPSHPSHLVKLLQTSLW